MASNSATGDGKKAEKSYIASAVESFNPWGGSRSNTPVPPKDEAASSVAPFPLAPGTGDHSQTPFYGQSLRSYPPDCPPLNARWFHAVDVPKRKPLWIKSKNNKPPQLPKKFVAFSLSDSRSIENVYQKLLEENEDGRERTSVQGRHASSRHSTFGPENKTGGAGPFRTSVKVPVNEDFLFDVDIKERELAPVYWDGPVYEVRRGTWFFQEGNTVRPCDENLAAQLEEGYLKVKPWLYSAPTRRGSVSKPTITPKQSVDNLRAVAVAQAAATDEASTMARSRSSTNHHQPQSHRLFGMYMNSVATYQDSTTAWLSTDSMLSWVTSSVYERFAGGGYMSGVKLVRGYSEPGRGREKEKEKDDKTSGSLVESPATSDGKPPQTAKRPSTPAVPDAAGNDDLQEAAAEAPEAPVLPRENRLQRQLSEFMERSEARSPGQAEEQIRKREEQEIQDDYNGQAGETQNREIEHLVLVTHGIGQLLTARMDTANFVHDVNVLRKSLKTVYSTSADLKSLNGEVGEGPGNCKIQVLPVCWRHLLDFPRRQAKRQEHDLGDTTEEDDYPSLEDITVEGVTFVRSLISDLALDVLLYQSAYREQISTIVLKEANRIHSSFRERNPNFRGKVHIMGHSLGSAIMFDILCRQGERRMEERMRSPLGLLSSPEASDHGGGKDEPSFDFDVEDLFCLGSPIGLFQMLKGRTIASRSSPTSLPSESPLNPDYKEDPFHVAASAGNEKISAITGLPVSVSSPKVTQLFNIFHPSDPVSYRLEPLISSAMSSLKPQSLPYTKKGIFGNVAPQGLTGIGAKVGQSVSGLFSSLSAGIASSLLNRSLGFSSEDVARMANQAPGAGGQDSAVANDGVSEKAGKRKRQPVDPAPGDSKSTASGNDMTLLDDKLETLYVQFQRKQMDMLKDEKDSGPDEWKEEDRKARRMRMEELKVRALNRNGRVDYCIQESVLDFNPINTIASHMCYWADEDVSHFVLSQMLANRSKSRR